ncbi:unnamed protein product, partial [Ectocarpus sp. 12 AP-2014]
GGGGWKKDYEVIASVESKAGEAAAEAAAAGSVENADARYVGYEELPTDMRPQVRDVLAFKTLSLNEETWTPELSPYRMAEVIAFDASSGLVRLRPASTEHDNKDGGRGGSGALVNGCTKGHTAGQQQQGSISSIAESNTEEGSVPTSNGHNEGGASGDSKGIEDPAAVAASAGGGSVSRKEEEESGSVAQQPEQPAAAGASPEPTPDGGNKARSTNSGEVGGAEEDRELREGEEELEYSSLANVRVVRGPSMGELKKRKQALQKWNSLGPGGGILGGSAAGNNNNNSNNISNTSVESAAASPASLPSATPKKAGKGGRGRSRGRGGGG